MSVVAIKINGTDITDDVMIAQASFSSLVNGALGQAAFRVKDVEQTYDFNSGDPLTLDVDSVRVWTGYVMQAKKVYALPVIDSSSPGTVTRVWNVQGLDLNVLFSKRIVYKNSDPTGKLSFEYSVDSYDDTIINDVFDHYVDIGGDSLTRGGVTRIAKAILDLKGQSHKGLIASAGYTWKQMMDSVQRATGGVYYISPGRELTYVDAETTTSDYTLTDTPSGSFDCGYQQFSVRQDGTNLINDMRVWGAGSGSSHYVYSRAQDAASIAAHGRWQSGLVTGGLFRQASSDLVASTYVNGTPQSHRGGKDDAVVFSARVFRPVFRAGDIVDIECGVYGYSDTLPLRSQTVTFVSPTEPIFDLVLTHAIDQALSLYEYLDIKLPGIPPFPPFPPIPPTDPGGCACGITDAFGRTTTSPSLGTSDCGLAYTGSLVGTTTLHANGSAAIITSQYGTGNPQVSATLSPLAPDWDDAATHSIQFSMDNFGDAAISQAEKLEFRFQVGGNSAPVLRIVILPSNSSLWVQGGGPTPSASAYSQITFTSDFISGTQIPITFWGVGTVYTVSTYTSGGFLVGSISNGSTTYTTLASVQAAITQISFVYTRDSVAPFTTSVVNTVTIDNLTIPEVTKCNLVQFDAFNRTVSLGWGTASPDPDGHPYTSSDNSNTSVVAASGVNWGYGLASLSSSQQRFLTLTNPGPWTTTGGFTATWQFFSSLASSSHSRINVFTVSEEVDVLFGIRNPSGYIELGTDNFSDDQTVSFTWLANTWYKAKLEYLPGVSAKVKVWKFGDPEPTSWTVTAAGGPAVASDLTVGLIAGTSAVNLRFAQLDFDYDGRPCYIGGGPPGVGTIGFPTSGRVCEVIDNPGDTNTFHTSMAFFSGTLNEVYVNGIQQIDVTSHGGADGVFILTHFLEATDVLYVCYNANGPVVV